MTIQERTAAWPTPGPTGAGFGSAGAAVVKAYATSAGIPGRRGGDTLLGRRVVRRSPALIMPGEILPEQPSWLEASAAPPIGAPMMAPKVPYPPSPTDGGEGGRRGRGKGDRGFGFWLK
jgi:hypothetical protein